MTTRTITHGYSALGTLATVTDPLMRTVTFAHDAAGRTIRQTRPDGEDIAFEHDESGNVITVTPPGRPAHAFTFTPVDLLETYRAPLVADPATTTIAYQSDRQLTRIDRPGGQSITAAYDSAGRLETLSSPSGMTTYTYTAATGRLRSIAAPGSTLTYTYDGPLPTGEQWSGGLTGQVQWTFDNNFRVTAETVNGGAAASFSYDADGLLTEAGALTLTRHTANGFVTAAGLGPVSTTFGYDPFGALASQTTTVSGTPTAPEVLLASAITRLYYQRDLPGSEQEFRRAIESDPGSSEAYFYYSQCLAAMGRFGDALDAARHAAQLDPLSPLVGHYIGRIHYFARQYDKAIDALEKALELNPNYAFTHMYFVASFERMHRYDRALAHRQKYWSLTGKTPEKVAELGEQFRSLGYKAALRRWTQEAAAVTERTGYVTSTELTHVYAELGDIDTALRWLARAVDDHARDLIYLNVEPGFDPLRSNSRFAELLLRVNR